LPAHSPPRIRLAAPADAPALLALVAAMHAQERLSMDASVEAALGGLLADGGLGFVLVAEASPAAGEAAGYAVVGFGFSLEFGGRDAFVDELFVRDAERGRGIGSALLAHAERQARQRGVQAFHLEVDHANQRARRLYERLGYKAHPRHLMTKWLDRA
jgi:ribosomal protein S18 acetylase RimI-like enzyme